jgi:hypothetical protein
MKKVTWFLIILLMVTVGCQPTPTPVPPTLTPAPPTSTPVPVPPPITVSPGQCRIRGVLPDPNCTPGVTNSAVTQSTIGSTICVSGWTKTIRPPASYTDNLKVQQIAQYGYSDTNPTDYEEDHLISLELGGNPTDPRNLWPQPRYGSPNAANKDKVENYLKAQVCNGKLSLADAQQGIATDWTQYLSAVAMSVQDISSDDPDDNGE